MLFVECFSLAVLLLFVALEKDRRGALRDAFLIALGAFLGEDTCIRGYGFYLYSHKWHLFADRVPVVVLLIWPAVVLSGLKIAKALVPRCSQTPASLALAVFGIVTFDAALIEPVAVASELWHWTQQGIFHVPLIGILGWGFYAGCIVFTLEHTNERAWLRPLAPVPAVLGAHLLLLSAWWMVFRHVLRLEIAVHVCLGLALAVSLVYLSAVRGARAVLDKRDLVARGAATSLFVILLAQRPDAQLYAYAACFTLPHLALLVASLRAKPALAA
jgi:uncharacterized membrane protein